MIPRSPFHNNSRLLSRSFPAPGRARAGRRREPRACAGAVPGGPWHRRGGAVPAARGRGRRRRRGGRKKKKKMPGKLKVKIVAGRHLPVMDRASDLTDAFVEVGGGGNGRGGAGPPGRRRHLPGPSGAGSGARARGERPGCPGRVWGRQRQELLHGKGDQTSERAARAGGAGAVAGGVWRSVPSMVWLLWWWSGMAWAW